jgi:hypothetical protein
MVACASGTDASDVCVAARVWYDSANVVWCLVHACVHVCVHVCVGYGVYNSRACMQGTIVSGVVWSILASRVIDFDCVCVRVCVSSMRAGTFLPTSVS